MKRAWRWTKRFIVFAMAFTVFATAVVIGAIHTRWGKDYIRRQIVAGLQDSFPGSSIRALEGTPFGTIVLRDVVLGARDGQPLVTVAELRVDAALRPLLHHIVRVDELALDHVAVFVRDQPPAPATPAAPASEPSAWTIELPSIRVDHARVVDQAEIIDDITLRAAARIPAGGAPIAASADLTATWRGRPVSARATAAIGEAIAIPLATVRVGDAHVVATNVHVAGVAITGTVSAFAPAALVRELVGPARAADVPGDVQLLAQARPGGAIELHAVSGSDLVDAVVLADLEAQTARGVVHAEGEYQGTRGAITAAITGSRAGARGIVVAHADASEAGGDTTLAIDGTPVGGDVFIAARATHGYDGDVSAHARLRRDGERVELETLSARASARHVEGLAAGSVSVTARGTVWPDPHVTFAANVEAGRYKDQLRSARASMSGAVNGHDVDLALGTHRIVLANGRTLAGAGGRVRVTDAAIVVDHAETETAGGTVVASARVDRIGGGITARANLRGIALAELDPTLAGRVDGDVDVKRSATGALTGNVVVHARGVAIPGQAPADGDISASLRGRHVAMTGAITSAVGKVALDVGVTGPRDITDARAWTRLPRTAVDELSLALDDIDLAAVGASGRLSGRFSLHGGELHVRGVDVRGNALDADVALGGSAAGVTVHASARTPGVPATSVDATVALPPRLFDPRSWTQLGRAALAGAHVETGEVRIDPALLARFGITAPYEATVAATLDVGAGGHTATLTTKLRGLRGGKLTRPLDADLTVVTDATGTHADGTAHTGPLAMTLAASTPLTVDTLASARTAPITASVTLPDTEAKQLLALLGETDVVAGTVAGAVTVSGTATAPTVRAKLGAKNLVLKAGIARTKPPTLEGLDLDARYAAGHAEIRIAGREEAGRMLQIDASADITNPRGVAATIQAANFDIAPLVALGAGRVRAARGTLNAALTIRGLDPQTGTIRGQLTIKDGRFPLSPELGTLRRATLDLRLTQQGLTASFDGRLGAGGGSVKGTLTGQVVGGLPTTAHLDMKLTKVSPIGALQPVIDADIVGNWTHAGGNQLLWTGSIGIQHGKIFVPPDAGNDLLVIGAPADMVFIDKQKVVKWSRHPPTKPWLITKIVIGATSVDVQDDDFRVQLTARGRLEVAVGDGLGVSGSISATKGDVTVLARHYRIDSGIVDFDDGTTDPRLDVRIVHDFKTLTLALDVRGRASAPLPVLTGDPGGYTQGQLLSFLLGADPDAEGSSSETQKQGVVSGGLAMLSGRITRRVTKYLPVKLDGLTYEPATSSSSQALALPLWKGKHSQLLYRQHLGARPDENLGEAVFTYDLRSNVTFEATAGENSKGGDFLWRTRW